MTALSHMGLQQRCLTAKQLISIGSVGLPRNCFPFMQCIQVTGTLSFMLLKGQDKSVPSDDLKITD